MFYNPNYWISQLGQKQFHDAISFVPGLLLDEVLAADKEVADMYLNRTNSQDDFGELSPPGQKEDSPIFTSLLTTADPVCISKDSWRFSFPEIRVRSIRFFHI